MTAIPPAPFPKKGVTKVQPLTRLPGFDSLPPWDVPAEAA